MATDSSKRLESFIEGPKGADPDGNHESFESSTNSDEESSTHGESIQPTPQDSYENFEDESPLSKPNLNMNMLDYDDGDGDGDGENGDYYETEGDINVNANANTNLSDRFQKKSFDSRMSYDSVQDQDEDSEEDGVYNPYANTNRSTDTGNSLPRFSSSVQQRSDNPNPKGSKHETFPSNRLLTCMMICIVLATGALIGFLTWFLWERNRLDPQVPPGQTPADVGIDVGNRPGADEIPTDEELLQLFATVNGEISVRLPNTVAGKAAQWMLNEDPGKTDPTLLPRSSQGWIQRYILAYTYYATTTEATLWRSCNPPTDDDNDPTCEFDYATEFPDGTVAFDPVPSYRWLSGADECLWGGVACGISTEDGNIFRSAVTSVMLADQNLEGSIVTELLELPYLQVLDLSHNGLSGSLTTAFGNLTKAKLSDNKITGTIPADMVDKNSPLEELDLGSNRLEGSIPATIGLSTTLKHLLVPDNGLTGMIPLLGNMPLETFQGQNNSFVGNLPFDYGYDGTWPTTLKQWWVSDNAITGAFPQGIGYLTNLEDLKLDHNQIDGTIPESIGALERLYRFEVQSNKLVGTVPVSVGSMESLQDLKIQFNGLAGEVPSDLCFMETMVTLEANCFFGDDEAALGREKEAQQAKIELAVEAKKGTNNDVIPVFSSLEEAVAAARSGEYVATSPVVGDDPAVEPPPQFSNKEMQCYCCTQCCNPLTGECLRFSTNEITTSSSGLITNPSVGLAKQSLQRFSTHFMEV